MAVNYSRSGNTATIDITVDVTDLVAAATPTPPLKVMQAMIRADQQLQSAIQAQNGAVPLNNQIASLQAQVSALPPQMVVF